METRRMELIKLSMIQWNKLHLKKDQVGKRRRDGDIVRTAGICMISQKHDLWHSLINSLTAKAGKSAAKSATHHQFTLYLSICRYAEFVRKKKKKVGGRRGEGIIIQIYVGGVTLPKLDILTISKNYVSWFSYSKMFHLIQEIYY